MPQGLDRRRAARPPRAADHAAGAGPGDRRAARRRPGTRRSTWSPAGSRALRAAHGADAVAVFGGGGLTNEKAYQLGKFARVALGTSQIDYNGRWCMSSAASAGNRAFGIDRGLPFPLADVEQTDVLVLVGSNLAETMPPAARHLDRLRERGGQVVVVDPRRTPTADRADVFLQPVPGTDLRARPRRCCTCSSPTAPSTRSTSRARTTGFDDVRRAVAAVVARAGRAGHRRRRPPSCARWPTLLGAAPTR